MKKRLILILALAVALVMMGCGGEAAVQTEPRAETAAPVETTETTAMETAAAEASGTFTFFCGSGGSIHFHSNDGQEYKTFSYGYALEYGQALNDVMGTEYGDSLIGLSKEGAEFTGWTLYTAQEISYSYEPVYDVQILCLPYNDSTGEYILLKNAALVGELMPTEQLCGMTCYGENYVAMANWTA